MATALGSDSSYMQLLEQARLEFYSHHTHLDEHTRQQLWSQTVSSGNLHNAAAPQNVPRSMSSYPPISQMPVRAALPAFAFMSHADRPPSRTSGPWTAPSPPPPQ